ncbi:MAG: cysteine hydrolase [Oscillospiraceae bacterium]|nr:cysteine hydrolase [Oscillospiraceae bacterium]
MKRALIVVDYQNDFVGGSLGFPAAAALEDPICEKIRQYKERGGDVIFTYDTHGEDYLQTQEGSRLPIVHCLKGTDGWQLYGRVNSLRDSDAPTFLKPAFGSMELAEYLMCRRYDEVELVGLVSSICVISNAILAKAALPECRVVVDAACTAGADKPLHEKALDVMQGLQIDVLNRG